MLTAVPDLESGSAWVQVLGRIAVHVPDQDSRRLTGSAQRLLSVLVASGSDGATAERIAEEIWGDQQPDPWRPALRMAVARLRKQLPPRWGIVADSGAYKIDTDDGWIDAWRLGELASSRADINEADLEWMLAGHPFGDIDLLELVAASTQHLRMLQITVAERFCAQQPQSITTGTCSELTALVRDHPYNDRLAVVVGRTLAAGGRGTEALAALQSFADTYASEFGAVPAELEAFLATGGDESPASIKPPNPVHDVPDLAKELRHLADIEMLGRTDELAALRNAQGALLTGAAGSGKSRLLAELILVDDSTETTYVVGDDRLDLALGPFAVAMPTLRDDLLATSADDPIDGRDEGAGERVASSRAWRIVLAHLEARAAIRPQRLIVDDAHLLDPASMGLLRLLIRSNTTADLTFIVAGRSDFNDAEWSDLVRDAERAGLDPIELTGLGLPELTDMVYQQFPEATREARHGLAGDVLEASNGLPAVAGPLITLADPQTLSLPEQLPGLSTLARVTAALSERAPDVVAASAVLGHQFSIGALIAMAECDESTVFDVLDELWSTGLIIETDDPDQVRFRHVLIQRALLEGIPRFRRSQFHRRAGELTTDPHARADHHADAGSLVPSDIAAQSLRESALLYAKRRQWRKVVRQLRRANELGPEYLDSDSLALWAAALDRSGSDGSEHRLASYELAAQDEDWVAALDAALSGLPEAERPDGDAERIRMLEQIPPEALPAVRRFDRGFNLSRQCALAGRSDEALRHANQSLELAASPDEVAQSHVCLWVATRHVQPQAHTIPLDVLHAGSLAARTRLAQIHAVNLAERGDFIGARSEAARFDELAVELGDPLHVWHSMGLKSMFLRCEGEFEIAEAITRRALEYADLHDMQQGASVYIGQYVHSLDRQDRLSELAPTLEPYRVNLSHSLLGRAALILCDVAAGASGLEREIAAVAEASLDGPSTFALVSQIYIARYLQDYAPQFVDQTRAALERFGDAPILASFGASSMGPTVRYVAQLTADRDEKRRLVERSVAAADEQGPLVWRVHTRLDLASLGVTEAFDQAADLAKGSGLQAVVERRSRLG